MTLHSEPYLPALKIDRSGKRRVDYRAIATLALPLFLDSLTYIVVGLTDTWFIGRLSTDATAAIGAINWLMFVCIMILACVGVAVQSQVAQAYGSGNLTEAAKITWMGIWAAGLTIPIYALLANHGGMVLTPFRLEPHIESLALLYWFPRMLGGSIVVADWTLRGFFNATNRTQLAFAVTGIVCILNAALNELFMFQLGWGIAGTAWATTVSQAIGFIIQFWLFLQPNMRKTYQVHRVWQPDAGIVWQLLQIGVFAGLFMASDLIGLAFFQMMQVELGVVPGAATQIVMTLLALAYQPVVGFGEAAIILVGQSIGAGDRRWAKRIGNAAIRLSVLYMVLWGLGLAIVGKWIISPFVTTSDPHAIEVLAIASKLLWIAASYQLFHALTITSTFCLQGKGDVQFPAITSLALCLFGFVPLSHIFSFEAGQGFVDFLPQFGFGVWGGWFTYALYMVILGSTLWWRWQYGHPKDTKQTEEDK
jgi:multidrug resistance protein, MATE family